VLVQDVGPAEGVEAGVEDGFEHCGGFFAWLSLSREKFMVRFVLFLVVYY
jgi:hypothetical protein